MEKKFSYGPVVRFSREGTACDPVMERRSIDSFSFAGLDKGRPTLLADRCDTGGVNRPFPCSE